MWVTVCINEYYILSNQLQYFKNRFFIDYANFIVQPAICYIFVTIWYVIALRVALKFSSVFSQKNCMSTFLHVCLERQYLPHAYATVL